MTSVRLSKLTKEYEPGQPVLVDINLDVREGELLALLGPSGCGKTTLLRLIAGLLMPTQGDIIFNGQSILKTPVEKRDVAMVFQEYSLFPFMSVGENVAFGLKLRRLDKFSIQERVAQALQDVQLGGLKNHRPDQLSGGQRQRVAVARAIVYQPKVLLFDEPLNNLELSMRERIRQLIVDLQQAAGITTIFVTHDQAEAVSIADRIALLLNGRLHQVGEPKSLYDHPKDVEVARFFGGTNIIAGVKKGNILQTELGELEILPNHLQDGEVLASIRPEAIEIRADGHNNLLTQIRSYSYRGQIAQIGTQTNGVGLQIIAPPYPSYYEGEQIPIHIPKDRIYLLQE